MPRGEYEQRQGAPTTQERVTEAVRLLEQGIDSIVTSEGFAAYLRTMARMHTYSFGNVILVHLQRPGATMVAGYRRWQELGRHVKKGEKGISILVPYKGRLKPQDADHEEETTIVVRGFGVGKVFDISQTDGEPLPEPPIPEMVEGASDVGMRLFVDLLDYLEVQRVSVSREETAPANGYFDPLRRHVGIGNHLDGDQATKTLTHEAAHAVAGHTMGMNSRDVETVAESAAFVVLNNYGVDSSGYSFPYVSRWARDRAVFKANLEAIQQTAHTIIGVLEGDQAIDKWP